VRWQTDAFVLAGDTGSASWRPAAVSHQEQTMKTPALTGTLGALVAALALSACATTAKAPTDAFQAADIAIKNADKDEAAQFAPAELASARSKMEAARDAVAGRPHDADVLRARRLADEAQADAELASALALNARAQDVNEQLREGNESLRDEAQRNSGESP
jgi:Domain of unknown function (DUF4398)